MDHHHSVRKKKRKSKPRYRPSATSSSTSSSSSSASTSSESSSDSDSDSSSKLKHHHVTKTPAKATANAKAKDGSTRKRPARKRQKHNDIEPVAKMISPPSTTSIVPIVASLASPLQPLATTTMALSSTATNPKQQPEPEALKNTQTAGIQGVEIKFQHKIAPSNAPATLTAKQSNGTNNEEKAASFVLQAYPYDTKSQTQFMVDFKNAVIHNELVLKNIIQYLRTFPDTPAPEYDQNLLSFMLVSYIASFRDMCRIKIRVETEEQWPLIAVFFKQLAIIKRVVNQKMIKEYAHTTPTDLMNYNNEQVLKLSHAPILGYKQSQVLDAANELCRIIRVGNYTPAFERLYQLLFIRTGVLLSGYFKGSIMDCVGDEMRLLHPKRDDLYSADINFIYRMAVRIFYIEQTSRLFQSRIPPMPNNTKCLELMYSAQMVEGIRQLIKVRLSYANVPERIFGKLEEYVKESALAFGDREIAVKEFPSCQLINDIVMKLYPVDGRARLSEVTNINPQNIIEVMNSPHRVDLVELIIMKLFFDEINGVDQVPELYDSIVIMHDQIEKNIMKLNASIYPFLIQLDGRFHLVCANMRVPREITRDIYEVLAYWLALLIVKFDGVPKPDCQPLRGTLKRLCGKKVNFTPTYTFS